MCIVSSSVLSWSWSVPVVAPGLPACAWLPASRAVGIFSHCHRRRRMAGGDLGMPYEREPGGGARFRSVDKLVAAVCGD